MLPCPTNADLQTDDEYNVAFSCKIFDVQNVLTWALNHTEVTGGADHQYVAFSPILMAPTNDLATIYNILLRFKETVFTMRYLLISTRFNMALSTKEFIWTYSVELSVVILIEDRIHFLMSVFPGVGSLCRDSTLRQLL